MLRARRWEGCRPGGRLRVVTGTEHSLALQGPVGDTCTRPAEPAFLAQWTTHALDAA